MDRYEPPQDLAASESAYSRYRELVDDWAGFCAALEQPLLPCIRVNTGRISRQDLIALLHEEGFDPQPVPWHAEALTVGGGFRPGCHWGFIAGLFQPQEAASMLPAALLDPRPGERALDLCAAPGNKTAQIADALGNRGTVVANDAKRGRHGALSQTLKRLGVVNVAQTVRDGQGMPWEVGTFDRVLVDAPCSCEGTFRKNALAAEATPEPFRERLSRLQQRLLHRGLEMTRAGGTLVYATCTFAPEENEAVVAAALERFGGAVELLPARVPGLHLEPGLEAWGGQRFGPALARCGRLWPHHNDTGGFFVAVFRRLEPGRGQADPEPVAADPDAQSRLAVFRDAFGVPESVLAGLTAFYEGRKYTRIVASDQRPPRAAIREGAGLPAVRAESRWPKPATAAALALGPHARRQVLEVDAAEAAAFMRRRAVVPGPERRPEGPEGGYVLVRYRGYPIGVGEQRRGAIQSLFPKAWGPKGSERLYGLEPAGEGPA
ncbi:RsmB/NOP family class I SAM-dependent RNA methyltransferase [Halorhodospira neutriphila]|nr:RsmB/NOP family class I SAM-dependent RNA methyltransferase [Halorhodospira neutriphila]